MSAEHLSITAWAGISEGLLSRPRLRDDTDATSENIASITYASHVKGVDNPHATGELTVADVMHATPQRSDSWTSDTTGYTFAWQAPGSLWPTAGVEYRLIVTFTPTDGEPFVEVWAVQAKSQTG